MKSLIEICNVGKTFAKNGEDHAPVLENINLQVNEGEFLAILGPSGSGKSTLLRIIAGLVPASQGTVSYLGRPISGVNPGVAMVFQSFALFPWLTVIDNVMLGLELQNLSPAEKRDKSLTVIDMLGLDGFENAFPKELSGGMRQRVGIGRALVSDPGVLLMDEAFSALDVLTAENLRRDLLELWLDHKIPTKSIILVTHGIEEAVYMADRAIILSTGPATIIEELPITIPRWREKKAPDFISLVDHIYSLMTKKPISPAEPTVAEIKKITVLPQVSAGALTGFLELLEDRNEKTDLYKLATDLLMDIEDFFPIVDSTSLLGFTKVTDGDIELTADGVEFAQATVLGRKELFARQLLLHLPFVKQILNVLQSKSNKHMNIEFFEDILSRQLGEEMAKTQIETLISWGRYAELIDYDKHKRQIYLE
ncbi:MAG TPA: nitrate/sulfonate/bicarbonate ABC transporter ATP-binding protein [Patescibacteria group bacterium]|nr:nitrate/sulfonate/bicarbonate ABC transporter ATP-binding protein [Patescibacteria group bacterium]